VELADSALHAPAAGFGDEDFYPDLYDKGGRAEVSPGVNERCSPNRMLSNLTPPQRDVLDLVLLDLKSG
jgi:hypothetical protein